MANRRKLVLGLPLALAAIGSASANFDMGLTALGIPYEVGGVGREEQLELSAAKSRYSLCVVTAVRNSGEYLAGAEVKITGRQGNLVFSSSLDGPILMIDLPPGIYDVQATIGKATQSRVLTIRAKSHKELFFYFE